MTYLNVSENPLSALPSFDLPSLLELRCLELGLTAFRDVRAAVAARAAPAHQRAGRRCPDAVRGLHELRTLDLRANRLTSVPDWIVELPRLEKLDLRWNEVSEVPQALLDRGCFVLLA